MCQAAFLADPFSHYIGGLDLRKQHDHRWVEITEVEYFEQRYGQVADRIIAQARADAPVSEAAGWGMPLLLPRRPWPCRVPWMCGSAESTATNQHIQRQERVRRVRHGRVRASRRSSVPDDRWDRR